MPLLHKLLLYLKFETVTLLPLSSENSFKIVIFLDKQYNSTISTSWLHTLKLLKVNSVLLEALFSFCFFHPLIYSFVEITVGVNRFLLIFCCILSFSTTLVIHANVSVGRIKVSLNVYLLRYYSVVYSMTLINFSCIWNVIHFFMRVTFIF